MAIEKIPNSYFRHNNMSSDLFIYDFRMTTEVVKSKVDLSMHMFSFLQEGRKQVHFKDTSIAVNKDQSLLIKKGNCLWTELLDTENIYNCRLLFFSDKMLESFLEKHGNNPTKKIGSIPFFTIENDDYIQLYLDSLASIDVSSFSSIYLENILGIKFEEIMVYLLHKYGEKFELYLYSLIVENSSPFDLIIKNSVDSNLKLEEIAFLCNMSLSTFKRRFKKEFNVNPGKWIQQKRLLKARKQLEKGGIKPSEIYFKYGYNNLSNFSIAYKNEFGISPRVSIGLSD